MHMTWDIVKEEKNAESDRKAQIDKIADKAEKHLKLDGMEKLYNITRQFSGNINTISTNIKERDGKIICKVKKQWERWKEHSNRCLIVLNQKYQLTDQRKLHCQ